MRKFTQTCAIWERINISVTEEKTNTLTTRKLPKECEKLNRRRPNPNMCKLKRWNSLKKHSVKITTSTLHYHQQKKYCLKSSNIHPAHKILATMKVVNNSIEVKSTIIQPTNLSKNSKKSSSLNNFSCQPNMILQKTKTVCRWALEKWK